MERAPLRRPVLGARGPSAARRAVPSHDAAALRKIDQGLEELEGVLVSRDNQAAVRGLRQRLQSPRAFVDPRAGLALAFEASLMLDAETAYDPLASQEKDLAQGIGMRPLIARARARLDAAMRYGVSFRGTPEDRRRFDRFFAHWRTLPELDAGAVRARVDAELPAMLDAPEGWRPHYRLSVGPLSLLDFVTAWDGRTFPIEPVSEPTTADGALVLPSRFFLHDAGGASPVSKLRVRATAFAGVAEFWCHVMLSDGDRAFDLDLDDPMSTLPMTNYLEAILARPEETVITTVPAKDYLAMYHGSLDAFHGTYTQARPQGPREPTTTTQGVP